VGAGELQHLALGDHRLARARISRAGMELSPPITLGRRGRQEVATETLRRRAPDQVGGDAAAAQLGQVHSRPCSRVAVWMESTGRELQAGSSARRPAGRRRSSARRSAWRTPRSGVGQRRDHRHGAVHSRRIRTSTESLSGARASAARPPTGGSSATAGVWRRPSGTRLLVRRPVGGAAVARRQWDAIGHGSSGPLRIALPWLTDDQRHQPKIACSTRVAAAQPVRGIAPDWTRPAGGGCDAGPGARVIEAGSAGPEGPCWRRRPAAGDRLHRIERDPKALALASGTSRSTG